MQFIFFLDKNWEFLGLLLMMPIIHCGSIVSSLSYITLLKMSIRRK